MKTFMNRTSSGLLAAVCMVAVLVSSCKKNDDPVVVSGDAKIKVVNAVQGSNAQDFYQGSTKLTTTALAYGDASDYFTVKAGSSTISFKDATTATLKASANVGMNTNGSYTAFYYTDASGAGQITGFGDDNTAPASGKAKVRFMNLGSAFNNSVNIIISGGSALINGLQYGNVSAYNLIDANVNALTVSIVGSGTTTVIPASTFQSGKVYTVWFDAANSTTANYHVILHN